MPHDGVPKTEVSQVHDPVAVITGPTHGIGRETAKALAARGYRLILLCRDVARGEQVVETLHGDSQVIECELSDPASVARAGERILRSADRCDVLINNAGIMTLDREKIGGVDARMAVNHLGHFQLTHLLLPLITGTPASRIVVVASAAHASARMNPDDPLGVRENDGGMKAYARSKLANVLFAFALARRLEATDTVCNALHPGVVYSNLMHTAGGWVKLFSPLIKPFVLDERAGARASVHLACAAEAAQVSGRYHDARGRLCRAAPAATDRNLQERLWCASEQWLREAQGTV